MSLATWRAVLLRDLAGIRAQIAAFPDDDTVWTEVPGLANPAGTLAIHLAGNMQFFIGTQLGGTGYVRDRDEEFAARGLPRAEIDRRLAAAAAAVDRALSALPEERLDDPFPIARTELPLRLALAHLSAHLAYHLGQMDYHRRVVTGGGAVDGMMSVSALR